MLLQDNEINVENEVEDFFRAFERLPDAVKIDILDEAISAEKEGRAIDTNIIHRIIVAHQN